MPVTIPATGSGTATPIISTDNVTADSSQVQNMQLVSVSGGVLTRLVPVPGVTTGATPDAGILAAGIGPGFHRIPSQQTASVTGALAGISTAGASITTVRIGGTYTGVTINFEVTADGSTWTNAMYRSASGTSPVVGTFSNFGGLNAAAANLTVQILVEGYRQVRANVTAIATGTLTIDWNISVSSVVSAIGTVLSSSGGLLVLATGGADAVSNSSTLLGTQNFASVYNGASWDRWRSVQGVTAGANTDLGIPAVGIGPGYNRVPAQQSTSASGALAGVNVGGATLANAWVGGTYTGVTINCQGTTDGTNWTQAAWRWGNTTGSVSTSSIAVNNTAIAAANGTLSVFVEGFRQVRVNVVAISTGTITFDWSISLSPATLVQSAIQSATGIQYAAAAGFGQDAFTAGSTNSLPVVSFPLVYNGSSGDRTRSHQAVTGTAYVPGVTAISHVDGETNTTAHVGLLRALAVGTRQTIFNDTFDTGVTTGGAPFPWTNTVAGSGTVTTASGETTVATGTTSASSDILQTVMATDLVHGATYIFSTEVRTNDTGVANSTRRWGLYTVSGTTPQDGYYFELSGTTFNAVSAKAGSATATASGSWTRNATNPFTFDTNYHRYDIIISGDQVIFMIDNVARHFLTLAVAASRTATLTLPLTFQSTNGAITTNETVVIRLAALMKEGDQDQTIDQLTYVPNSRAGITAAGIGPGYDIKQNPTGIAATSTANAVVYTVDGADTLLWAVTTIGTTPGSMIFEYTNDDGTTWITHGSVMKLGVELWIQGAFVPAVGDVYMTRATGHRQIRCRVNAVYASGTFTTKVTASTGNSIMKSIDVMPAPHNFGYTQVTKTAQYTTTQTSTALWTPASGKRVTVTSVQIQVGGTTAGTLQLYFGSGAYTRGTNQAIFDGEFAPSATLKPGVVMTPHIPYTSLTANDSLRVTDSAAINPLTVTVWGYEVV